MKLDFSLSPANNYDMEGKNPGPDRNAVFSKSIYLYGVGGAIAYGLWGLSMKYYFLFLEEIILSLLFLLCHLTAKHGHMRIALVTGISTILYTSIRFSWVFGWGSGTHVFILALIPLIANAEKLPGRGKRLLIPLLLLLEYTLWYFLRYHIPLILLPHPWDTLMALINQTVALGVITFSFFFYGKTFLKSELELELAHRIMSDRANRDGLTGTYNRRFMEKHLQESLSESSGNECPLAVALIDIDNFKSINDTYGHNDGDLILKSFVHRLQENLREDDHIGRWGGEEFLIVLRKCPSRKAIEIIERLKNIVGETPFAISENREISVTATMGVALSRKGKDSWERIISEADGYLYRGKSTGKNRVVSAETVG